MVDEDLLRYLHNRHVPQCPLTYARVLKASQYINMDQKGRVWITGPGEGPPRQVPQLKERAIIVD